MTQAIVPSSSVPISGMNQMMELFKMQYLMKFLESSSSSGSNHKSFFTIFILLAYDQLGKYFPYFLQLLTIWFGTVFPTKQPPSQELHLLQSVQPPSAKTIQAFIQFERAVDGKLEDPRIDAVLYHVCNLPEVRSLRYNGVEMIPNFKDALCIETDVWFELLTQQTQTPVQTGPSKGGPKQESIVYRLSTYDHTILWLHRFVEQAMERFEQDKRNQLGSEQYYFDMMGNSSKTGNTSTKDTLISFTKSKFMSNRTLQNVYLKQSKELQGRVEFFLKRRDWYDIKGIPHTLGIVMYGTPGCGKTSTIKAIANTTKRHIFNLLLSEIKTKDALKELFYSDEVNVVLDGKLQVLNIPLKQRLYVIEDIDAMNSVVLKRSAEQIQQEQSHKLKLEAELELLKQTQGDMMARNMMQGKDESNQDKLDLATLLNVLDGVRETPGRIIILSTNYPERLDEALLRPGRFDMMLEFEKHSCAVLQQHLEAHYDVALTKEQLALVRTSSLEKKWTPAEVSQILFRRIGDLDGAIQDLLEEDPSKLFRFSQQQQQQQEQPVATDITKQEQQETVIQSTDLLSLLKDEDALVDQVQVQPQVQPETEQYLKTSEKHDPAQVFKDCVFSTQSILFGIHADMGILSANDTGLPRIKQTPEVPSLELPSHTDILTGQQTGQQILLPEQFGSLPAEYFGFAAANEDAEPFLDDYFPDVQ